MKNIKFCCIQSLWCMSWCVMFAYLVPLYQSYGYNVLQISIITTTASIVTILCKPIYAVWCSRAKQMRTVLIPVVLVSCIAAVLLYTYRRNFMLTLLSVVILNATSGSVGGLIDAWEGRLLLESDTINYGLTRASGSLFYALTAALFGRVLDQIGFSAVVPSFLVLSFLLVVAIYSVHEKKAFAALRTEKKEGENKSIHVPFSLWYNTEFLYLLLAGFLLFFASNGLSIFFPLRVEELGGNNGDYGLMLSLGGISEVAFLLLYRRLAFYVSDRNLLQISFMFFVLQFAITALSPHIWLLKLGKILQGPSNGLYMAAIVHYIPKLVGAEDSYTANMTYFAVISVAAALANLAMGFGVDMVGLQPCMIIAVCIAITALVVFSLGNKCEGCRLK